MKELKKILPLALLVTLLLTGPAKASHLSFLGAIDTIDHTFGIGGGVVSGTLSSGVEDDWLVFGANAGDILTITATVPQFKNMVLLQDTSDGIFNIGDTVNVTNFNINHVGDGSPLEILAHIGPLEFQGTQTLSWTALFTGAYGIGITAANESFAGDWTINLSGNTANVSAVPVPAAVWLFSSGLIGLFGMRKKSSKLSALSA